MRNQLKPERASQPTTQPQPVTKCATCAHRHDLDYKCGQHDQTSVYRGLHNIVLECAGYTLSSEAVTA